MIEKSNNFYYKIVKVMDKELKPILAVVFSSVRKMSNFKINIKN